MRYVINLSQSYVSWMYSHLMTQERNWMNGSQKRPRPLKVVQLLSQWEKGERGWRCRMILRASQLSLQHWVENVEGGPQVPPWRKQSSRRCHHIHWQVRGQRSEIWLGLLFKGRWAHCLWGLYGMQYHHITKQSTQWPWPWHGLANKTIVASCLWQTLSQPKKK